MPDGIAGFAFAGVRGGIKAKPGRDVGLIVADRAVSAAAVFTGNRVKAAPVVLSARTLKAGRGRIRAIVVNSGNANACTGARGMADAKEMQRLTAAAVGCAPGEVLVASTGVIGVPLPMARVAEGIAAAAGDLRPHGADTFADAILTTDRRAKTATRAAGGITLWGCTKGAGMIAPNMATTLTFIVTDAAIGPAALAAATRAAVAPTYNAIAVDGDTSTNDTLAVLASGRGKPLAGAALKAFTAALTALCDDLARQLMGDGEGVHHVVAIRVRGATSPRAASQVARRIATSPLVKTAIAGGDPNWGRILCAIGNAGVPVKPERISVAVDAMPLCVDGAVAPGFDEAAAAAIMQRREYALHVDLGAGKAEGHYLACDLSHEYVSINADYRT